MIEKICLCSVMEAGEFDNKYRGSAHRPEAINWMKRGDGSHETGLLEDEEINAKVRCQCGRYMETHLGGKYHKRMVAVCSCDNPKPEIMECFDITEETKEIAGLASDDVARCKGFIRCIGEGFIRCIGEIKMAETYKREDSDTIISIGHRNLVAEVSGFARKVTTEDGMEGILIFIPTGVGKALLDIIKVKP